MKGILIMKKSLGFTLAEVLITLAIIGVVAAMTIPSVIVNTNQAEFRTGFRKAISVLNSSLTMNIALEGESPYDNTDLFSYLQQHMSVMESTTKLKFSKNGNAAFYTTDGMRFEFPTFTGTGSDAYNANFTSYENGHTMTLNDAGNLSDNRIGKCGTKELGGSSANNSTSPCLIMVDVNGDKKPNPANADDANGVISYPGAGDSLLRDAFSVMITDEKAIPLGATAQKAMYQSQK